MGAASGAVFTDYGTYEYWDASLILASTGLLIVGYAGSYLFINVKFSPPLPSLNQNVDVISLSPI